MQRTDIEIMPGLDSSTVGHGRYLADHIPNARLVELPGRDMMWWVGDADAIVDEIELFVTRGAAKATEDVAGIGVHIAARVMSAAGAGEVFVSRTVVDLVTGSGMEFENRGSHALKGVPGTWRLFGVTS